MNSNGNSCTNSSPEFTISLYILLAIRGRGSRSQKRSGVAVAVDNEPAFIVAWTCHVILLDYSRHACDFPGNLSQYILFSYSGRFWCIIQCVEFCEFSFLCGCVCIAPNKLFALLSLLCFASVKPGSYFSRIRQQQPQSQKLSLPSLSI